MIERKAIDLEKVKYVVLDEADEMLNMGFREDIELVIEEVDHPIQTMLFSATMPKEILNIINKYQKDPQILKVTHTQLSAPNIEQVYLEMKDRDKMEILTRLIDIYNYKLSIVFCNTKKRVDEVTDMLQARGYMCDKIHGDMKQTLRMNVISKFKRGDIEILVATDVAARGIHVGTGVGCLQIVAGAGAASRYCHRLGHRPGCCVQPARQLLVAPAADRPAGAVAGQSDRCVDHGAGPR